MVFYLVTRVSHSIVAMKTAMLAFEALAVTTWDVLTGAVTPAEHILVYDGTGPPLTSALTR